jgi:chromosome segregation ATPase
MKRPLFTLFIFALFYCLLGSNVEAADDARLRETLRTLTLRLRSAETERNNLLTEKAQFDQEKKTLTDKTNVLTKQAAADKETITALTKKTDDQDKQLVETKEALDKWKAGYDQIATAGKKSESERARLADEVIVLKRKVEDRETKNAELFRLGNEILRRYERFGLGDALAAREPFTGITKVKLENLVQDYQDKLADARVKPEQH